MGTSVRKIRRGVPHIRAKGHRLVTRDIQVEAWNDEFVDPFGNEWGVLGLVPHCTYYLLAQGVCISVKDYGPGAPSGSGVFHGWRLVHDGNVVDPVAGPHVTREDAMAGAPAVALSAALAARSRAQAALRAANEQILMFGGRLED